MPETDSAEEPVAKQTGGRKSILISIAAMTLMTLVAAAMGGGLGIKLADQVENALRAQRAAAERPADQLRYQGPAYLKEIPPAVTNLADPSDVWIRVESSIVFDDSDISTDDVLAAEITEDFVAYLRTVKLSQIDSPSGMNHLRDDLADRAVIRSEGRVREIVIRTMVVQ